MIKNQWYAIIPSKEIKKDKLVATKRLGLDLCLFRGSDGVIGCVSDKCSHRGASISKGKVKGNCVQCPFHGLEFDKEGKCKLIPANGRIANIENRFNVTSYLVKEAHEMIYIWFGDKEKATNKLPFFEEINDDKFIYSEVSDTWNAHYSRCIENQLDVVHVPFVHHNTIGRGNKTLVNGPALTISDDEITIYPFNSVDNGNLPLDSKDCKTNDKMNLQFKFPNIWQNKINDKIRIIIFFAPVDDEKTIFYIRFYTNLFKINILNSLMAQIGKIANKIVENQDKPIVETQIPKISELSCGENLIKGDSPIIEYRKIRQNLKRL